MQLNCRIEGRMRLSIRRPGGPTLHERRVSNTVLRSGAELVGALIAGKVTTPLNGMGVGIDATPAAAPYETPRLTINAPDGSPVLKLAAVAIIPAQMEVNVLPELLKVRVSLRAVLPPDRATSPDLAVKQVLVAEAGLGVLAPEGDRLEILYNRVVFEPVPKTREHELALYWEVDFPYGI